MNLTKKKELAAKALRVGKNRIIFNQENLSEIKEAITRQDIRGLYGEGIIGIKPVKGRKKVRGRKNRRGPGKIKKKIYNRKQIYVKVTRKLRKYLILLRDKGIVDRETYWNIRKKIRMRDFKSKAGLKEYLKSVEINIDGVEVKESKGKKAVKKKTEKEVEKKGKRTEKKESKLKKSKDEKK